MKTKIIVLTGGVYSSLGKGITSGSIGRILKELGYSISILKFDPYLNINPAQISPLQHGELFVTNDGTETDLDIGHYERFSGINMNKYSSVCSGKIYKEIIDNQLANKYGGSTIQVVPHITDLIIEKVFDNVNNNHPDFLIIEIGGTVGDIESIPFYEAIKRLLYQNGAKDLFFIHCVPVLVLSSVYGEVKTKPAQHSIERLRTYGINPDILVIRSENKIEKEVIEKISKLVLIQQDKIFNSYNLDSTYKLINELYNQNIHKAIFTHFGLKPKHNNLGKWNDFVLSIAKSEASNITLKILITGEYTSLHDGYFSIVESLKLSSYYYHIKIDIDWLETKQINPQILASIDKYDIVINGGSHSNQKELNMLFDKLIDSNVITLNYNLAFGNLINYINFKFNINLKTIITNNIGLVTSNIINSDLIKIFTNQFNERHINSLAIINDELLIKTPFKILSKNNDGVDGLIANNNQFIAVAFCPEFTSKPNDINNIYKYIISKALENK